MDPIRPAADARTVSAFLVMTNSETQQASQNHDQNPTHVSAICQRVKPSEIVLWVEHHLESWRRLMHFIGLAGGKKFDAKDEEQFLELKGGIVRELELILASGECVSPVRGEVHELMNSIPSLRYLSQVNDGAFHKVEHQWHLIYIEWHAALGRLKAKYRSLDSFHRKSGFLRRWLSR